MVFIAVGSFSSVSASLVVEALQGINGKKVMFGVHWCLTVLAIFWASLVIVAAAHFGFWGMPGISDAPRIICPWRNPQNGTQPGPLLDNFLALHTSP